MIQRKILVRKNFVEKQYSISDNEPLRKYRDKFEADGIFLEDVKRTRNQKGPIVYLAFRVY